MSMRELLAGSGNAVKSVQSGFFAAQATGGNNVAGRDGFYLDITIPAVSNISKCVIHLDAHGLISSFGFSTYSNVIMGYNNGGSSFDIFRAYARLLTATTLRVSTYRPGGSDTGKMGFVGQYQIVEYN